MRFFREFVLFGVSGVLGFVADSAVLYLLKGYMGLFAARAVSFLAAVLVTWIFNRAITFSHRRSGLKKAHEFTAYLLLMLAGGSVNYGLYAWLVVTYDLAARHPVIAVAAGSLGGMLVNLATSRWLLFQEAKAS